tara:strand:- start:115 stop:1509 length:1395 start_codon:yes stop_codon:yes gene_type:complete
MPAPETKQHFTFADLELESVRPRLRTGAATGATVESTERLLNGDKSTSMSEQKASMTIFFCCYNFFCCWPFYTFPGLSGWCNPCLGDGFCCGDFFAKCFRPIRLGRKTWLRLLHLLCFAIHTGWLVATIEVAWGKGPDMQVEILRVKPQWKMPGKYGYEVAPSPGIPYVRYDLIVCSFFALSALMHGMWVIDGLVVLVAHCFKRNNWGRVGKWLLWDRLDQCLCWWRCVALPLPRSSQNIADPSCSHRWLEYSASASVMFLALGIAIGVREQNALATIFFLSFTTMWLGFVTEMLSRPRTDMKSWEGDPDPKALVEGTPLAFFVTKMRSYAWRMAPHVLGFFPYITAWVIIINNFVEQLNDLPEETRKLMPEWVVWAIAGSVTIFSLFTFVQIRYQWIAPEHYWRTELWYCALSATSKVYLGALLYANVLMRSRFSDADFVARWTPPSAPPMPPTLPPMLPSPL